MHGHADRNSVPWAAKWLGGLGLIPFAACALASVLAPPQWSDSASQWLVFYGAVILSFLGGIQWGMAIRTEGGPDGSGPSASDLALSVVPALLGWFALLVPAGYALVILAVAFASVLAVDLMTTRNRRAPDWYPKLRWPLTVIAIVTLIIGAAV
ncbi:DUF3429 domain-containing protein [Hoeflea sp.]|uniref:DUF3429 domain-containing protein n=1 Tax=Hoeflea sp. TaxID=1940281 RepID=UPI003B01EBF6